MRQEDDEQQTRQGLGEQIEVEKPNTGRTEGWREAGVKVKSKEGRKTGWD